MFAKIQRIYPNFNDQLTKKESITKKRMMNIDLFNARINVKLIKINGISLEIGLNFNENQAIAIDCQKKNA